MDQPSIPPISFWEETRCQCVSLTLSGSKKKPRIKRGFGVSVIGSFSYVVLIRTEPPVYR